VALEVANVLKSGHVEHVHSPVIRASYYLPLGQPQRHVDRSRVVLNRSSPYRGKRGAFGYLFEGRGRNGRQLLHHRVGITFLAGRYHRGAALVQGDQQRPCLRQLVLEYVEVGLDALEPVVVDFWGLVVHRHQVVVVPADVLGLGLVSSLEDQLLQQLPQSYGAAVVLAGQDVVE
jgi:hypothetical protein